MTEFLEVAKQWGMPMALVVFFIWWSYKREKALGERLGVLETYTRDKLEGLVVNAISALAKVADVIENCKK